MGIKKGEDYYLNNFKKIHNNKYTYPNFKYNSNKDSILIVCPIHGEFKQTIGNHNSGKGCLKCAYEEKGLRRRSTIEDLKNIFKEVHGDLYSYDKFTEYNGANTKIDILCIKHNEYFKQRVSSHKRGNGCPKCGKEKSDSYKRDTQESFIEKCEKLDTEKYSFENVKYVDSTTKVDINCKEHGIFKVAPYNFLNGKGCPKCNPNTSKAETEIIDILKNYFIDIEQSNKTVLNGKELDIYIPSKKLAIEYNGLYWHSDNFKDKNYHSDKLNMCLNNGIRLIQIFEDEWLYKKDIVISRIKAILGVTDNRIYARNCEIRKVTHSEACNFLDNNHIQGSVNSSIRLGLYYKNELISIMTFGALRKSLGSNKKEGSFELLRFCNKINTNVIGGASKLLKYFEINNKPLEIISYADLRWSIGDLYKKLNFEFVHKTKPNYFYTKGSIRENRFKYRKSELLKDGFDKNSTEKEIMKNKGYYRIYDVGTLKFIKTERNERS